MDNCCFLDFMHLPSSVNMFLKFMSCACCVHAWRYIVFMCVLFVSCDMRFMYLHVIPCVFPARMLMCSGAHARMCSTSCDWHKLIPCVHDMFVHAMFSWAHENFVFVASSFLTSFLYKCGWGHTVRLGEEAGVGGL